MKKHRFNIFPEMTQEDYARLKADIQSKGYDNSLPIWVYRGEIIDGWNRQRACNDLGISPEYAEFKGNDAEAIEFVMRTNKRRNNQVYFDSITSPLRRVFAMRA